ncbi:hypothetical protein LGK95_19985 [Clostridium algoriphilum]|uniref:hypothetical protein n=1 Tax=Clostridium algoriphilum TaxID=198347 RepID=UPI001CF18DBA|nr:hypothetical protein [Clostridium algoriphilum]MCB2295759.1 hypothetical protein [Clostridium algoriphilum]
MAKVEKNIWSFKYPEFQFEKCVTGWTWFPCPTLREPGRMCKKNIQGLCKKTKTSQFRVFVKITYPDNVGDVVKREINRCSDIALGVATGIIIKAATASSVVGPQATIAAAIGAIGPAAKAYGASFYACLARTSVSQVIRDQIKASLSHEDKAITGWRGYYDEPMYDGYSYEPMYERDSYEPMYERDSYEPMYSEYNVETVNNEYNLYNHSDIIEIP